MIIPDLEHTLSTEGIKFDVQVDLKRKTWIHRGGIADYYIIPDNTTALERVMSCVYANEIPHLLVGSTSNLYILNTANIPVVISTLKCNNFKINDNIIECDCGVQVSKLSCQMIDNGIQGFEYLTKLPGTVGAAICNNSSVKSERNSITNLLLDVDLLTPEGIKRIKKEDLHLGFRTSDLKKHILQGVILKARLKVTYGDISEMEKIAMECEREREKHLEGPTNNLGCTVHKMFCNGPMPNRYSIPQKLYSKILSFFVRDNSKLKRFKKNFLLTISGHRHLLPYISDKQLITFIWRDDNADKYFDEYLCFMREVCKTDQVEIEIIK